MANTYGSTFKYVGVKCMKYMQKSLFFYFPEPRRDTVA